MNQENINNTSSWVTIIPFIGSTLKYMFDEYENFRNPMEEVVESSYDIIDGLDEKYDVYTDFIDRENLMNDIVNIAENTRTNPAELVEDLDELLGTGYFNKAQDAATFSASARDILYFKGDNNKQVNENVDRLFGLIDKGEVAAADLIDIFGEREYNNLIRIASENGIDISGEVVKSEDVMNTILIQGEEYSDDIGKVGINDNDDKVIKDSTKSFKNREHSMYANKTVEFGSDEYNELYTPVLEKIDKSRLYNVDYDDDGSPIIREHTYTGVESHKFGSPEFDRIFSGVYEGRNSAYRRGSTPYDFEVNSVDHSGANYESDAMYGGVTEEGLPYISNEYFEKELEILEEINQNVRSINVGLGLGDVEDSYGIFVSPIPLYSAHGDKSNDKIGITPDNVVGGGTPIPLLNPHGVQEVGYGSNSELSLPSLIEEMSVREEAEVVRSQEMYNMMVEIRDLLLKATLVRPNINVNVVNHINNQSDYTDFVNKLTSDLESAMSTTAVGNYGGYV